MTATIMGRPKEYTAEFIQNEADEMINWFNKSESNVFLIKFATLRGYSKQRFSEWAKSNPYFSEQFTRAKEIQEARLLEFGLNGRHKEQMSKFVLVNHHDYKERSEQSVKTEGTLTIQSVKYSTPPLLSQDHNEISVEAKE